MGQTKPVLRRLKIKKSIRKKLAGTSARPRISIFRSNKEIYAQIIDDSKGITIASASSVKGEKVKNKVDQAKEVGLALAEKAKSAGVIDVVFDRGGYLYHGRVKSLADGAREGGLNF
jgi:large subunit ribosomal protein L18